MRSPTGTGVLCSENHRANHGRTLVQKILNPAFDLRISIPAKKNELAGWIDDDHLRMSAARKASSWAEVMKVVELPARDTKALIRPLRTKSLSAAKTAARFVRAPEIRIAFSMIPLGISKFIFTHKTYFFLRIKQLFPEFKFASDSGLSVCVRGFLDLRLELSQRQPHQSFLAGKKRHSPTRLARRPWSHDKLRPSRMARAVTRAPRMEIPAENP